MTISAHAPVPAANRLIDADTVDLAAIRRTGANVGRWPANQPYTGRAVVEPALSDEDADLLARAASVNPAGVYQLARAIRSGCPVWCSEDHRGQVTEVDGFSIGLGHERILTELTAAHTCYIDQQSTATVLVESVTERGEVTQPARITLSVAPGTEGRYPDGEQVAGWSGSPEQARTLAAALLAAADLLDGGDR